MKKLKIKILLILFLLITLVSTLSSAAYKDVTMSIIEEPICTINFGTKSTLEKKLISKDLDNKEVTIQLKVSNNEESIKPTGEIMLLIDNSKSMSDKVNENKTREALVIDSAKTLIKNLLEDNTKLKIGIVSFSTNTDISKEGTIEDAKLISDLSNNSEALISSVSNIEYNGDRTNLDSGIQLAKKYFTDNTDKSHKYFIILSDGIPNVAIDYDKNYYSDDVITRTKSTLTSLSDISDNVFVMLTGITDGDKVATPSSKTFNEIVKEIFGTEDKPSIGNFYYIQDNKIEDTIKNNIYNSLVPKSQTFTDIKVTDVFPKEIIENFNFSYTKDVNIGTISTSIDKTNNSITWIIPELKSDETAIVQYKLKLNTNYNNEIINKTLNTNTKIDISYKDSSNATDTKTSSITPKLKLTENLPTEIPKAGNKIFYSGIIVTLLITIILGIRYLILKNNTK